MKKHYVGPGLVAGEGYSYEYVGYGYFTGIGLNYMFRPTKHVYLSLGTYKTRAEDPVINDRRIIQAGLKFNFLTRYRTQPSLGVMYTKGYDYSPVFINCGVDYHAGKYFLLSAEYNMQPIDFEWNVFNMKIFYKL